MLSFKKEKKLKCFSFSLKQTKKPYLKVFFWNSLTRSFNFITAESLSHMPSAFPQEDMNSGNVHQTKYVPRGEPHTWITWAWKCSHHLINLQYGWQTDRQTATSLSLHSHQKPTQYHVLYPQAHRLRQLTNSDQHLLRPFHDNFQLPKPSTALP